MGNMKLMLACPKCDCTLKQLEAKDHYGFKLFLFKCTTCSGIWVDGIGKIISRLGRDSAVEVDSDTDYEEMATEPREIAAACPRCESHLLEELTGKHLPEGLHIDYCTKCHGFWFDEGELALYKNHIEEKGAESRAEVESGGFYVLQFILEGIFEAL
jgi:Zn-finger nucleic acid-binding protein